MSFPGQASGDFIESSSALRILYVGHRNSLAAKLVTDGFTQTNPPQVGGAVKSETLSATPKYGVLSGSVAFTRGSGMVGGPTASSATDATVGNPADYVVRPLGLFINDAAGNAFENSPAPASGQAPYVSGQGTCGTQLYETHDLAGGGALTWKAGDMIYASRNGYITNVDNRDNTLESAHAGAAGNATVLGVVKIAPDSTLAEIVFDLRV
jgi:hypothetical protein